MENKERVASLKDRLGEALRLRGMKAIELSEKTSIPKGQISYYLAGKAEPKADRLHQISVALGVSEAWLLGFDVQPERTAEQKKNDDLANIIVHLRRDSSFCEMVSDLASLSEEESESIKRFLSVLKNK